MTPRPDEETGAPRRREPDGGFGAWFRSKECSTVGAHHEITPCWDRQYRESTIFFRPPVSVPLISLDQYRTERYSNNCMSRLGVPRGIRAGGPRLRASNRKTSWRPDSNLQSSRTNLQSPISLPPGPPISNVQCRSWAISKTRFSRARDRICGSEYNTSTLTPGSRYCHTRTPRTRRVARGPLAPRRRAEPNPRGSSPWPN